LDSHLHISEDGSHTVFSQKYHEHYHSVQGALDESVHIFIISGLYYLYRKGIKTINIFEMGFGTGLNALLSLLESEKYQIKINYYSIESDPVDISIVDKLNYNSVLNLNQTHAQQFRLLHELPWNQSYDITENFSFKKIHGTIEEHTMETEVDLIYYDAFSPTTQMHLWEEPVHKSLYQNLKPGGMLVTYCTKGTFKRMLQNLGYKIEKLKGPGRKREILRAFK